MGISYPSKVTKRLLLARDLRTTLVLLASVLLLCAPLIFAAPGPANTNYLALVFHIVPPPTPTLPPVKALINGDFEQGRDVGWTAAASSIVHNSNFAHTGEWSALLGGTTSGFQSIGQQIMITADAPYLIYWSSVYSEEYKCTYDSGSVYSSVTGFVDQIDEFCAAQQHGYRRRVIDLRRWIGYTIDLRFYMFTDASRFSGWNIDDVSMQAKP